MTLTPHGPECTETFSHIEKSRCVGFRDLFLAAVARSQDEVLKQIGLARDAIRELRAPVRKRRERINRRRRQRARQRAHAR